MLTNNHYLYSVIADITKLSESLTKDSGYLKFISYNMARDNGNFTTLSSREDWCRQIYTKYFNGKTSSPRLKTGINYWKSNANQEITEMAIDARDNFDIAARIEFVYRDKPNKCFHVFAFYTDRKNEDRAYNFYGLHSSKLINFIAYFNRVAAHHIAEASKPENLITIPDYTPPPLPEPHRKFVEEMQAVGASVNLGDRETEIMILYAAGCTSKQIAEIFCRSISTIETHLEHIRKKTGCKDRKEMNVYVRDLGLSGMERFFFSYFTH